MFTGLVHGTESVISFDLHESAKISTLVITNTLKLEYEKGDSISIDGCCLTALDDSNGGETKFELSRETIDCTRFKWLQKGQFVNVERAMLLTQRLDGHLVSGHVDTVGAVSKFEKNQDGWVLNVTFSDGYKANVIPKGSVCINGVSLTINELIDSSDSCELSCTLIPLTVEKTNLKFFNPEDQVNLEFDLVGKYILRSQGK